MGHPFANFTRGALTAREATCAAGYRIEDEMACACMGRRFRELSGLLGESEQAKIGEEPDTPLWDLKLILDPMVILNGPWLVANHDSRAFWDSRGQDYRAVTPLRPPRNEPEGHRRFARLMTPRAIRLFANRYGLLGPDYTCVVRREAGSLPSPIVGSTGWSHAEHLTMWRYEIAMMRNCVQLLDWINQERTDLLRRFVHWGDFEEGDLILDMHYFSERPPSGHMTFVRNMPKGWRTGTDDLIDSWEPGDVLAPARYMLTSAINHRLHNRVHPMLSVDDPDLHFHLDSLLTSLYASLALEYIGKGRERALCARDGCGNYFTVEHRRQKYCDENCRKRAHDERKTCRSNKMEEVT